MTEDRRQRTEDRGQRTDDRRQKADDRRPIINFELLDLAGTKNVNYLS